MSSKSICFYCEREIEKVRVPSREGGRLWRWATTDGNSFYCPKAGGECWHVPKRESESQ